MHWGDVPPPCFLPPAPLVVTGETHGNCTCFEVSNLVSDEAAEGGDDDGQKRGECEGVTKFDCRQAQRLGLHRQKRENCRHS